MKFFLIFSLVFFSSLSVKAQTDGCSKVYSALVFDEKTGDVLSETRSETITYPASLVKLMTLYLTFEAIEKHKISPDDVLTISERGEEISKVNKVNTMNLKEGDKITVREAIRGVIVKSFNEAAVTLAEAVSGSEWEFVRQMNEKAQKLGMVNTSYRNASGLHEEGQYTTTYDLARLVRAMNKDFPGYYHLFGLKEFDYRGAKYETHNHVLIDYKGAEGMKTGFTTASGFNLISSARKNDSRIISVLMGCSTYQQRDEFTKELLDQGFDNLGKRGKEVEVKITKGFDYGLIKKKGKTEDYQEDVRYGGASQF